MSDERGVLVSRNGSSLKIGTVIGVLVFCIQLAGIVWAAARMSSRLDTATLAIEQSTKANTILTETVIKLREDVAVLKSQVAAIEVAMIERKR